MIEAVLMMGGLGLVVGAGLAVASKVFYVYVDPLIEEIEGTLPGANCGGCGLAGCSVNAASIAAGKSAPTSCVAGFTREMAVSEASRCLQCGLICYKRTAGVLENAETNFSV